jgi:ribosomal protein L29
LVVLLAALYFWRVSMALVAAASLLGLAAWACYRLFSKSGQAHAAMEENDYAAALLLLQQSGDHSQLTGTLRFKVPFPGSAVKESFLEAVRELLTLQEAAADPANPHLPQGLRDDLARRTGESLASLWPLCQKLTLLARSRVQPELLDERISAVAGQLEELAQSARATRHQLAHITLGASELEIHEATEQVGAMKWQVGEMRKLDGMIDG